MVDIEKPCVVAECSHSTFAWLPDSGSVKDSEKEQGIAGYWLCLLCNIRVDRIMGSGICHICKRPIDVHYLMDREVPLCRRV